MVLNIIGFRIAFFGTQHFSIRSLGNPPGSPNFWFLPALERNNQAPTPGTRMLGAGRE